MYEFYDNAGNLSVCSFDITVYDNEAPSIVCPASFTNGNTPGNCTGIVSYSTPNGTDNCPGSTTVQIAGLASGATYPVGVTTNTFRVTDASGNTATCSFTVTISDSELPVITCPANVNQNVASGTCGAVATYTAPVGTDNCPGSTTLQTAGLASGATFPVGTTTNTFRVTDASGNSATCSFTVTITDNELPGITCPANVSQNVTSGTCGRVVTFTSPVGSDNCSGPTTIQTAGFASGATFPVGTTTNTFRVTDASGNTATCSFTVTVVDNEDPMTICQNITTYLNNGGTSTITATQINNGSSDACGIASLTLDNSSFTCANVGSNTVVLTVTDVNANTATCAATVSIQDTVRPIAMCRISQPIWNNGGTSTITATQINNGLLGDACGIASLILDIGSFTCANVGSNTVVLTVTDVNGNTASCAATVSVQDTVRPIAVCQNLTSFLNNAGTSTITATQINNGSSDACGIASLTLGQYQLLLARILEVIQSC
ncbi:MAG: HYR domain-containing protein [Saprospiraceae bacterium]|nr:HYR domain-containing protein [Saprospiraceae bacterium]